MVAASLAIGGGVLLIAPVLGSQAQDHVSVAAAVLTDHSTPVRSAVPLPVCDYLPGQGYLEATAPGDVLAFGSATLHGTMMDTPLQAPVVGMAETPDGRGYWLVASDGGIFALGDAGFHGSMGGQLLDAPVVGMATTPDGGGYWLVASDGGIFAFGDAGFAGSMGGRPLNAPVVGIAPT